MSIIKKNELDRTMESGHTLTLTAICPMCHVSKTYATIDFVKIEGESVQLHIVTEGHFCDLPTSGYCN